MRPIEDIYELSPLQRGMLLHSRYDGDPDMYLSQHVYTVDGPLDADALVRAWQHVFTAHPALRTSFHWDGLDKPLQVVHRDVSPPAHRFDWSGAGEPEQRERMDRLLADDRGQGFDLAKPPLQRLYVIRLGAERYGLAWSHHHLLLDGWSVPIFMNEVMARYQILTATGPAPPPPPPAPPFRDYIAWLRQQDLAAAQRFWTDTMAGFRSCHLAPLRAADPRQVGTGAVDRHSWSVPGELERGLRVAAVRHQVTLSALLQAAWAIALRRYTGTSEVTFGAVTSGRPAELAQVDRMVGLFANTLPVPVTVPDDGDLGSWLRDLQNRHAQMRRYEFSPLADIKRWAGVPGQQLFESLLSLDNYSLNVEAGEVGESLTVRMETLYDKVSVPLSLVVTPEPVSQAQLVIHRDRFPPGFAQDALGCLRDILSVMAEADRVGQVTAAAGPPVTPVAASATPAGPATLGATATGAAEAPPVAAATPAEETIAAVYQEVLGIDEVDVTRSFFELGGDSFAAVRAISRLEGATVGMLAANPSVRAFATALAAAAPPDPLDAEIAELERQVAERAELERRLAEKRAARQQRPPSRPLVPVPRDGPLVCTYQQEAVWFEQQLDPSSAVYHIPFVLRLRGALEVPALQRALHALVVRHEALRTRFVAEDGLPRQVVDPPPQASPLPVRDLPAGEVAQWAATEVRRPFDLAAGPLVRTALARTAPHEHVLVLVVHHIIADGLSVPILAAELAHLYQAETTDTGTTLLPELPVQPADHAAWQRSWLRGDELERQLEHWRQRLAELPTVDFPADRPRPADPSGAGATTWRRLPEDLAEAGRGYARANQVSFLAVLHAALLTVLHRYTGQSDLPVGSIFTGRTRAELEPLVGYFVNAVVLRTNLDGDPSFAALVRRCYDTVLDATGHQDVPFSLIVDALRPERVPGRNPLFQIGLELQPARSAAAGPALGEVTAEPLEASTGRAHFDLNVVVYEAADGSVDLSVEYATELYDPDRIDRFIDHYLTVLAQGLAGPDQVATGIEVMPAAERQRVLHDWSGSTVDAPAQPLHRMVEAVATATPDAIAVVDHDGTPYTYRWLDSAANRLGNRLRRAGVGPGDRVGVCLRRGIDLVTALLATWKAGSGYVPLEPDLPPGRLAAILADAEPSIVVSSAEYAARFPAAIIVGAEPDQLTTEALPAPGSAALDETEALPAPGSAALDELAYLLYPPDPADPPTAVPTSHRTASHRVAWLQDTYRLRPDDRVLHTSPSGLDGSVWELAWPLASGATVVLAAPGSHGAARYLHQLIDSRAVTTVHFAPTALDTFLALPEHPPPSLRRVLCSGEALPARTARRFLRSCRGVDLHHLYRPGAACPTATAWQYEPDRPDILIGRPITGTRARVLDDHLRPVPTGIPGRLFIAGTGAPGGYHNRPALTATRLLPDPHAETPGQRMYATGDLARWRADGTLQHLGRADQRIRLRGQRADPDRIADALAEHPGVRQCAVVLREPGTLTAYLVGDAEPDGVRRFVTDRLPSHLIPTDFLCLPALPMTPAGTLDLTSLPAPPPSGPDYLAPRTDTERWLADTWRGLLGVPRVGLGDDFFALGANSLHLTQLAARIREHLNIDLPPRQLFAIPTLAQLATLLEETDATPGAAPITPVPRDRPLPGTYQQEGLWFVQQFDPDSPAYHLGFGTRLRGELDVPALQRALHTLVVRHEALRTRFEAQDGLPWQVIDPPPESLPLPVTDLSAGAVERWTDQEIRKPLDLARGPVFRAALARVAPDQHVLALVVHHIVADGWSVRILAEELAQCYAAESSGTGTAPLPQLLVQPADHAVWQRGWLTGAELDRQLDYWRDTLADLPTIDLPTDRLRPANPTGAGSAVSRRVPDELAATARAYARDHQVSFLALLQAALLTVLHRYTGQTDLPIGSIFSGRTRIEIEPVVGYFVNAVVLRTRLDGQPSFADLVRRCHDTVVDASGHQDTPFGLIVDALRPERVAGRNPLFQIALSLLPAQAGGAGSGLGGLRAEPVETTTGRARFDLAINVDDAPDGGLYLSVEYSTELFDPDRIDRLIGHYLTVLTHGLAEPDRDATDLEIMSLAERQQLLPAWSPEPAAPVAGAATATGERGASW